MNVNDITLYYQDQSNNIRFWTISAINFEIVMEYGKLNGESIEKLEYIEEGKGGRTREEQLMSRINSRIESKKNKGYVETIEAAKEGKPKNRLGLLKPMLAQRFSKQKEINMVNALAQYKYDGHRCIVTKQDGKTIAYSRNGKLINSIEHILINIDIKEGVAIDGELYIHGMPLQKISSLIRRPQKDSNKLKYYVYDIVSDEPFSERLKQLLSLDLKGNIEIAKTWDVLPDNVSDELRRSIQNGYEGLIIRLDGYPYQDGKRSKGLLKVKQFYDDEFLVTNIYESKDGWAKLECLAKNGKTFRVSAPGNIEEKTKIFNNRKDYIGKSVKIEFAGLTQSKIPFHPIAICFRDKNAE